MKTYNKKQDIWNRFKLGVILIALLYVISKLVSCSPDPEPLDPIIGKWNYSNQNVEANFEITILSNIYRITEITVNGEKWNDSSVSGIELRQSITRFSIAKDLHNNQEEEGIVFKNAMISGDKSSLLVDTVIYIVGNTEISYYHQVVKKN
jgi:hypothetical protein